MASFVLKLGNLDLAQYVRAAPDQGFDPVGNDGYLEPSFTDGPFAEGQPLVNVDAKNRLLSWPLILSSTTKDGLLALIDSINQEVIRTRPLRVEWKDAGATYSTFFDVAYARLEPEYNFRRGERNAGNFILKVWCAPPYGHTASIALVATARASSLLRNSSASLAGTTTWFGGFGLQMPIASLFKGDAPALADLRISTGSPALGMLGGRFLAVSVLPHASYQAIYRGNDERLFGLGNWGGYDISTASSPLASGAYGDAPAVLVGQNSWGRVAELRLSPASIYFGRNRLLLMARSHRTSGLCLRMFDSAGVPCGPTAMATSADYAPIDLGLMNVPTSAPATVVFHLYAGRRAPATSNPGASGVMNNRRRMWFKNAAYNDYDHDMFGGFALLPEDLTTYLYDGDRTPIVFDSFSQNRGSATVSLPGQYDQFGNRWTYASGLGVGNAPYVGVDPAHSAGAGPGYATYAAQLDTIVGDVHMSLSPAKSFQAAMGSGANAGYWAVARHPVGTANDVKVEARVGMSAGGSAFMSLHNGSGVIASAALVGAPSYGWIGNGSQVYPRLHLWTRAEAATAVVELLGVASAGAFQALGASHAANSGIGRPGIAFCGTSVDVDDFGCELIGENQVSGNDIYQFDIDGRVTRYNTAYTPLAEVGHRVRGPLPIALPPNAGGLAIVAMPNEGGSCIDALSAEVRVRERFIYSRGT